MNHTKEKKKTHKKNEKEKKHKNRNTKKRKQAAIAKIKFILNNHEKQNGIRKANICRSQVSIGSACHQVCATEYQQ